MRIEAARKVGVNMMHTPYGYKIVDGQAVIDEPVAEKIRNLYAEFLTCGSMRAAAAKAGIEKTHSVIGRLLKNEVYLGDEYYPQMIDEKIFCKVQELRNSNAKSQNRIRDYIKQETVVEDTQYRIGKVQQCYENPYLQAEYAYGLIEEEKHE